MQFKRFTANPVAALLAALSFATVARSQDAGKLIAGRQERAVVIAAIQAVIPEGRLNLDGRWLCRPTSVDPKCHLSSGSINDKYQIGITTLARLSTELQTATGNKWQKRVGPDRPTVRVERPWLYGDSVVMTVQIRPGKQPAPGDTLTTLHQVVLEVVGGRIATRSVSPSTERPQIPADSTGSNNN